jgi:hypothetical protein
LSFETLINVVVGSPGGSWGPLPRPVGAMAWPGEARGGVLPNCAISYAARPRQLILRPQFW